MSDKEEDFNNKESMKETEKKRQVKPNDARCKFLEFCIWVLALIDIMSFTWLQFVLF